MDKEYNQRTEKGVLTVGKQPCGTFRVLANNRSHYAYVWFNVCPHPKGTSANM